MTPLLTAAEMRAVEAAAMETGRVTGADLMERAGRGVVEAIHSRRPDLDEGRRRAVIWCGPGNNGGDGYVIARHLAARGWRVETHHYGDPARQSPDAAENLRRWREAGGEPRPWPPSQDGPPPDLWIDALFGTGLTRALPDDAARPLEALLRAGLTHGRVVAVDGPSGLCLDSGRPLSEAVIPAALTVTFHRPRLGHHLAQGPEFCGDLRVADIGLSAAPEGSARLIDAAAALPTLKADRGAHKHLHGHALVLSGGVGRGGAARLAARGALRVGAGLVTLGCPPAAIIENAARLDAIMLRPVKDAAAFDALDQLPKLTAICLGMGFGAGQGARDMVAAIRRAGLPAVLDADALTSFEDDPAALFAQVDPRCILTPHPGEFRRLFPDLADRLSERPARGPAWSRADAAREAAARANAVILLKGPDTVIADPQGRLRVASAAYGRETPWLATAGAGDVLAGLCAGLLARGLPALEAASAAAWLHQEAALTFGPGLIAEDLPEALPRVFRTLAGRT